LPILYRLYTIVVYQNEIIRVGRHRIIPHIYKSRKNNENVDNIVSGFILFKK